MTIKFPHKTINQNRWTAFHSQWGVACGRLATLLWDSRAEVEEWISHNLPHEGQYTPIPWILPADLVNAEIYE